jgi:hypothetical protein
VRELRVAVTDLRQIHAIPSPSLRAIESGGTNPGR